MSYCSNLWFTLPTEWSGIFAFMTLVTEDYNIEDYDDAVRVLLSYDVLPDELQVPAYLLAMAQEYGFRLVASGRLRSLVDRYEYQRHLNTKLTVGYEVDVAPVVDRYKRDVEWIVSKLDYNTQKRTARYYWEKNRAFFYPAHMIASILQYEGAGWVTIKMVKEAKKQKAYLEESTK